MAQTEFTGRLAEVTFDPGSGVLTLLGLLGGTINETGKNAAEQLDVTTDGDTAYTYLADPLGAKGAPKATVTIQLQDSTQGVDDAGAPTIPLNDTGTLVVDMAKGTTNANTYTHTAMQLVQRVTTIPLDKLATCELTFEANSLGAWTSPA